MSDGLRPCPFRRVNDDGQILCELIKGSDREITLDICRACPVSQVNCQHLRASLEKQVGASITVRFLGGRTEIWDDHPPAVEFKRAACAEKAMPIHTPRDCAGCPIRMPQVTPQGVLAAARQHLRQRTGSSQPVTQVASGDPVMPPIPMNAAARSQPEAVSRLPETMAVGPTPAQPNAAEKESTRRKRTRSHKTPPAVQETAQPASSIPSAPVDNGSAGAETEARAETKSKVILLQQWLAAQARRKSAEIENADIVQDIPTRRAAHPGTRATAPVSPPAYEGTEKCVGWTD